MIRVDELFIDLRKQDYTIAERFENKDIITLEELLQDYENVIYENENLQEEIDTLKENVRDYYTEKSPYSVYGVSESEFH